jgi:hypothetical protein
MPLPPAATFAGWRHRPVAAVAVAIASAITGCSSDAGRHASEWPTLVTDSVEPNPNNLISARFHLHASGAHRAKIEVRGDPEGDRVTRDVPIANEPIDIPVLGLFPDRHYLLRAIVWARPGAMTVGEWHAFRSGPLPGSIVSFEVDGSADDGQGLTLLAPFRTGDGAAPHPAVIIDSRGRVVWYREAPAGIVDLQLQPNGHLTAAIGVPSVRPFNAGTYVEWDAFGNLIRSWVASGRELTDQHELRLADDGREALLFAYEARVADLTRVGGPSDGILIGDVLQRIGRDGTLLFEWSSLDHYAIDDADDFVWKTPGPAGYDFSHSNAIEVLPGGDYLVSARHLSEITRIDHRTGDIVWRMGKGRGNQFRFVDDPKGGFANMHAVRRLSNGHLLLIDNGNGHVPPSSRAVEYEIDEVAMTATLVWSFEPGIFSCCMGYAQRLPNGNTLVNLGQDYRVFEVSPAGEVVWRARLPSAGAGYFGIYRASRIASLDDLL